MALAANRQRNAEPGAKGTRRVGRKRLLRPRNEIVFDLAAIRGRIGPHWAEYGPSVHRIAKRVLAAEMEELGSFVQHDDAYVLCFDDLAQAPARAKADRIMERLTDLLFLGKGLEDASGVEGAGRARARGRRSRKRNPFRRLFGLLSRPFLGRPRRRSESVPRGEAPPGAEVGNPDEARPVERATAVRQAADRAPAPPQSAPVTDHTGRPDDKRAAKPATGAQIAVDAPRRSADDAGVRGSGGGSGRPRRIVSTLREARAIEDAMALAVLRRKRAWFEETQTAFFPPPDLDFIYRPMWFRESHSLTTYCCVPIARRTSMTVSYGDEVVPRSRLSRDLLQLDSLSLDRARADLDRVRRRTRRLLLLVSLHASTLMDGAARDAYLDGLRSLPEAARQLLVLEIVDMDDLGHTGGTIRMLSSLRSYCRTTVARVPLNARSLDFWKVCRLSGVGIDVAQAPKAETSLMLELDHFASQAQRHQLFSYIRGLDKMSLTIAALGAGFNFLEGAAIGSMDTLDEIDIQSFEMLDLYRRREDPDNAPADRTYLDVAADMS